MLRFIKTFAFPPPRLKLMMILRDHWWFWRRWFVLVVGVDAGVGWWCGVLAWDSKVLTWGFSSM